MKVQRELLLKELEFALPGLGKDSFVEGTHLLRFHGKNLWTFNHEVAAMAKLPTSIEGLDGAINGEKLYQFVSKAPGALLEFTEKDGMMQIRSDKGSNNEGYAKVSLPWLKDTNIPYKVPAPSTWQKVPKGFANALTLAASCCSEHLTRRVLTCVRVQTDSTQGSDGIRAIQCSFEEPFQKEMDFLLPVTAAHVVANTPGIEEVSVDKRNIWFKSDQRYLICSSMGEEYPDLSTHLQWPKKAKAFTLPFKDLDSVLDRAKVFSAEDATEGERLVDIIVKDEFLFVKADGDISRYEECVPVGDVPSFSISLAARYLLDLVSQEDDINCTLLDDKLWVKCSKWQYVSMVRPTKK